jgi:predicted permease
LAARTRRATLLPRIAALPGVEAVATYGCVPFDLECVFAGQVTSDDPKRSDPARAPLVVFNTVTPDFARVMRIPVVAGRDFDAKREGGEPNAALINEAAAKALWSDGHSPVGRKLFVRPPNGPPVEVIGVVADAKLNVLDRPALPAVYLRPESKDEERELDGTLLVRTRGDEAATLAQVQRELAQIDPGIAIYGMSTVSDLLRAAASSTRFIATLLVGFAAAAAFLAALGVYGVLAYMVAQRTREFGIRLAIGATPRSVLSLVVGQGATLTVIGLALGVAGAFAATGVLTRFLFGVARVDVITYASITALVGLAGLVAAYLPARRATRVDPATALRA